jgi:hypothetical protein
MSVLSIMSRWLVGWAYGARVPELAQVNVALMRAGIDDPVMAGFAAVFDPVNRLAEQCPGFVWRLRCGSGHPVLAACGDGQVVVNVSVWRDYPSLHAFVYRSAHGAYLRHRARWFHPGPQPSTALWWVRTGAYPTVAQAQRRLAHLRAYGPTPQAFTLRHRYDHNGRPERQRRPQHR